MGRGLELVQGILDAIDEIKKLANEILVDKAIFLRIAYFLVELRAFIEYLFLQQDYLNAPSSLPALQSLATGIDKIFVHARGWTKRSRIYLLYRCIDLVKEMNSISRSLADSLNKVLEDLTAIPLDIKDAVMDMRCKLLEVKFSCDLNSEELARTISTGLTEGLSDEAYSTSLLQQIATHLRMPLSAAAELKMELYRDKESAESEGREDFLVLKDLYKLFEKAASLTDVRRLASEDSIMRMRNSLMPPSSFFCPITGQVMQDPVVVEGGFTYERSAILEWFERGHRTCPDTGVELASLELTPNLNLRKAMEEFYDRMSKEQLTCALEKIREQAGSSELKESVDTIQELIDHNPMFKRYVVSFDGLEPLVAALKSSSTEVKLKIMRLLCGIAEFEDDYKIVIVDAGVVPILLRFLTKYQGNGGDAVHLLWEISKVPAGRKAILAVQGSIVVVASAISIGSSDQKEKAEKLLNDLCNDDPQVVVQVAEAGYYKPLVVHFLTGNDVLRKNLATSVHHLDLNESTSVALVSAGIVPPLLAMLQNGRIDSKIAAAKALRCLSCAENNKDTIAKAKAIPILVECLTSINSELKIEVTASLAHLAANHQNAALIHQEGATLQLLGMLKAVDNIPNKYALKTLETMAKISQTVRLSLRDFEGVPKLVGLLQSEHLCGEFQESILGLLSYLAADRETRQALGASKNLVQLLFNLIELCPNNEHLKYILVILHGTAKVGPEMQKLMFLENPYERLWNCWKSGTSQVKELVLAILSQLANPSLDPNTVHAQLHLARLGVVQHLVEVLQSGSNKAKKHAVVFLHHLSLSTPFLSKAISSNKKLLAKVGVTKYKRCKVHLGKCSIKKTLCLIKTGAVPHLVYLIKEGDPKTAECAVDALLTLLNSEETLEQGVDFLMKYEIVSAVVQLVGKAPRATELAVKLFEKIYKCTKYREEKHSRAAVQSLTTAMSTGTVEARRLAASALMHLNVVPHGSTFTS